MYNSMGKVQSFSNVKKGGIHINHCVLYDLISELCSEEIYCNRKWLLGTHGPWVCTDCLWQVDILILV
jgi:hypothetical protein